MTTIYSYDITNDLPGGKVNTSTLLEEIQASSIVTTLENISTSGGTSEDGLITGGTLDLHFASDLTAPEKTTLDGDTANPAGGLLATTTPKPTTQGNIFYGYDSLGGQTFTSASITLNIDLETISDASMITLSNDVITFHKSGTFFVISNISIGQTSNSRTEWRGYMEIDAGSGFSEVIGTRAAGYSRNGAQDGSTGSISTVLDIEANSEFRVRVMRESGSGTLSTIQYGSRLVIVKLR